MISVALGIALACEPIVGDPVPAAPINSCPQHPCDAYKPGAVPSCNAGVCTVAAQTTNLLLVIGLATDSYFAPGRTYLTTLGGGPSASGPCALPVCSPPLPCALPKWITQDASSYVVDLNASKVQANWYLGNGAATLPVQATFRRLFGGTLGPAGTALPPQDALDLGLPLDPIQAVNVITEGGSPPGPNGTPEWQFKTYMQPGCYERTLQPFAPFSRAFPPEIKAWPPDQPPVDNFDETSEEMLATGQGHALPRFDIFRAEGLAGWTAYLRNIHTKRVFSNVAPLTGSLASGVTLLTDHEPSTSDEALTDLELVLAPPANEPLPTEVFAPLAQELAASQRYPSLPTPVTMTGRIATTAGAPVSADVYFTATNITDRSGQRFPPNFEFATRVSTTPDRRTGASTYSALLPRGDYQIAVRPTDGSSAIVLATRTVGGQGNTQTSEDFDVSPLVTVSGTAVVADTRPLAEAIAEVVPTACATSLDSTDTTTNTSDSCMPRPAQTVTDGNGAFALAVDPGMYLLRVRPREGSRLPWKVQSLAVGATPMAVGKVVIPAPVSVGMQLTDSVPMINNPLINAVVSVFTDPSQGGPAIELGQAITDGSGNYEMYLALPIP